MESEKIVVRDLAYCFFQHNSTCRLFDGQLELDQVLFNFTTPVRSAKINIMDLNVEKHTGRTVRYHAVREALRSVLAYANKMDGICNSSYSEYSGMGKLTSTNVSKEETDGLCMYAQVATEGLDSPYFDYLYEDKSPTNWLNKNRNYEFSSMVESFYETHNQPSIVIFKYPSKFYELVVLIVGIAVLVLSFAVTCLVSKHSNLLFEKPNEKSSSKRQMISLKVAPVPIEKSSTQNGPKSARTVPQTAPDTNSSNQ